MGQETQAMTCVEWAGGARIGRDWQARRGCGWTGLARIGTAGNQQEHDMTNWTKEQRELIRLRMADIERENGGRLTPDAVIADARDKDSPLHMLFEWNVKKAAMRHWIDRAREIITSVQVMTRTDRTVVTSVYYVRDPHANFSGQGYVSIDTLRTDQDMAREAICNEFSRVGAMLHRARSLALALGIEGEVNDVISRVENLRRKASRDGDGDACAH